MSRLKNGQKDMHFWLKVLFFSSWHPKSYRIHNFNPKSYDEHPRQVKYRSPPVSPPDSNMIHVL